MQKCTFNRMRFCINKNTRTSPIKWHFSAWGYQERDTILFNVDDNLAQVFTLRINTNDMMKI